MCPPARSRHCPNIIHCLLVTLQETLFFRKSCRLWDNVENIVERAGLWDNVENIVERAGLWANVENIVERAGSKWKYNTAHAHCMLGAKGYKRRIRMCNTYCFSSATMVARTRLNVTLYLQNCLVYLCPSLLHILFLLISLLSIFFLLYSSLP